MKATARTRKLQRDKAIYQPGNMRRQLNIKERQAKPASEAESEKVKRDRKDKWHTKVKLRT